MTAPQHRYSTCRDRDCEAPACVAYRDGREDGYQDGHADGYAAGYAAGAASAGGE
jgi:flagellar biosynthesis/type III secretory pathway protein FliH